MVNFNPGEFRGFHGRWQLGGPRHPHLRHHKGGGMFGSRGRGRGGAAGRAERQVSRPNLMKESRSVTRARATAARASAKEAKAAERAQAKAAGVSEHDVNRAEAELAAERRQSADELARAEHEKVLSTGKEDKTKTEEDKKKQDKRQRRGGGTAAGLLSSGANLMQIGSYLHPHRKPKKAAPKPKKKKPPAAKKKKAPPKAKKPAHKVATRRIAQAHIKNMNATGKTGGAKGTGQIVKPSAEVMANLRRYVATP